MVVSRITIPKTLRKDYYRLQANMPARYPYIYNPIASYLPRKATAQMRNRAAEKAMEEMDYQFELLVKSDPGFKDHLRWFLINMVEPELHEEVLKVWRARGLWLD